MVGNKWKTCKRHGGLGCCNYSEEGGVLGSKCFMPAIKWGGNCKKHAGK